MKSEATTVAEYLRELPEEDRKVISAVRKVIRANLPKGIVERMNWGLITYEIPLSRYPKTYNGQPLAYAGLARQKNYFAVYLTGITPEFRAKYKKTGKKLDAGAGCVRFKKLDDLPLDLIGEWIGSKTLDQCIAWWEARTRQVS